MLALLQTYSWQELRHHPWRHGAAVLAVALGVALAFSVHLINASALDEFDNAVRSVAGQPDLELRAMQGSFDEAIFERLATHPQVALASPILETSSYARSARATRVLLRVIGVDALSVAAMAPALMPQLAAGTERTALFAPQQVFLNAAARQRLGSEGLQVQRAMQLQEVAVAGTVAATGSALAVMDIGAMQDFFDRQGQLSRIDLRLRDGVDRAAFAHALQSAPDWPADLTLTEPGDALAQVSNMSRAYRVNLSVLALVALFTGAFLVYSVLSLSIAKRAQQFALLGVLGLSARQRLELVLCESLALGLVGSAAGILLGAALAWLALHLLGGDLGGGYFSDATPALHWSAWSALLYAWLGVVAALAGGWWPARNVQRLPLAPTLKGLGATRQAPHRYLPSIILIAVSALLATAPAVLDIPVAAYLGIGLLLLGGITALPWLVAVVLDRLAPHFARQALVLLAIERARRMRESAAVAVSGVVAALSLAVALTVMVASFRNSMVLWLDQVLPADLYVRAARHLAAGETVHFSPEFVQAAARLGGVQRLQTQRQISLQLDARQPRVALIVRQISSPARDLPLTGAALAVPPGQIGIYVSEAMLELHGARLGAAFAPISKYFLPAEREAQAHAATFVVAGVWRDYAHQAGAIAIDQGDFERLTGDRRANDLALWLNAGTDTAATEVALRALAERLDPGSGALLEFGSASQIRATSLRIFDRSFAVTYWLQAVAIGIGLFGVAASFSAQVLARRKEFGLLAHLGLRRSQILGVVALEGAAWTTLGALAGLGLGLAVSLVLVYVVNPQSFHWSMDLALPWLRLLGLCLGVVGAGTLTAWLSAQAAAGRDAVLAVKEDW